ncbi:c-type cytochrome biogenesis protein CcsB, partial [Streptomyces sp. NPDC052127]
MTLAATTELAAATNENLASISNTLIYSAMAVYTLAFFAYIAEWLLGSRSKVGRTAAALTATTAAKGPAVTARKKGGTAVLE